MKINALIIRYKKDIIHAIGVQDDTSMVNIEIDEDILDIIKSDKETLKALPVYIRTNIQQSKTYVGEGDVIYFLGDFGHLSFQIEECTIVL